MADWDNPDYYRFFASEAQRGGSVLYEAFSLGIAEEPWLQTLAAHRQANQPPANVLFAAVHYLLLCGADSPLKAYYPSLGGTQPVDAQAFNAFFAFCRTHEEALIPLIASGVTNTNEVGRCSFLAPSFSHIASITGKPLALIEIGPSAGLNLNFDRFHYIYRDETGETAADCWGPSPLSLVSELRSSGVPPLPVTPPLVSSRIGLELSPVDLNDTFARQWLKALVWPERLDRHEKLDAALQIAQAHPPAIRAGSALDLLPDALAHAPADAAICVYHSMVTYQFTKEMKQELSAILQRFANTRPLWRVSVEGNAKGDYPLRMTQYHSGNADEDILAKCDPHGLWIDWVFGLTGSLD